MIKKKYPELSVLLVDDEKSFTQSCTYALHASGINNVITCNDSRKAMPLLSKQDVGLLVLDLAMPYISGTELLGRVSNHYPEIPVIILTCNNEIETAVECMKSGAFDYIVKPIEESRLLASVKRAIEMQELKRENLSLKKFLLSNDLECPEVFSEIVSNNVKIRSICKYVETVAKTQAPVLITGKTGVGKELVAKAIHALSGREGEFIPVNAAGIDESSFSDTLFGHAKGAFTGADNVRKGLVEMASGGTLFLDEIGDMSVSVQMKLLRFLEEGKYYPLGSDWTKSSDARMIFATNRDLQSLRECGSFREDLYYRLRTHEIDIPPLQERLDDLPLLVDHFLEKFAKSLGKKKPAVPSELYTLLSMYHFPGNIRELKNLVFDALSRHEGKILSMNSFRETMAKGRKSSGLTFNNDQGEDSNPLNPMEIVEKGAKRFPTLKEMETIIVREALKSANGNQTIAAEVLGLSRSALSKRLNRKKGRSGLQANLNDSLPSFDTSHSP